MVYVDSLLPCVPTARWPFKFSCHLFGDSETELHNFAAAIGLKREWFQSHPRLAHYDLTSGKRNVAIRAGAIPVDKKFMVSRFKPAPGKAVTWTS